MRRLPRFQNIANAVITVAGRYCNPSCLFVCWLVYFENIRPLAVHSSGRAACIVRTTGGGGSAQAPFYLEKSKHTHECDRRYWELCVCVSKFRGQFKVIHFVTYEHIRISM